MIKKILCAIAIPLLCSFQTPEESIESFWNDHIHSFTISHGTTSLYLDHFKQEGITHRYPKDIEDLIAKIRKIWANHEQDITPRTGYFKNFEIRRDAAQKTQKITISFSAKTATTAEYTQGNRHGGEWARELRYFLSEAEKKKRDLSLEEQNILVEAQSFINLIDTLPPMIIKIHASCPDLHTSFAWGPLFSPLPEFIQYVKKHCEHPQNPEQLSQFLTETLLPALKNEKERLSNLYEITLYHPVSPEYLEFEILKEPTLSKN